MRIQYLLLLALLAVSCQSGSYRLAFEGRLMQAYADEGFSDSVDEPIGASVVMVSLPIPGVTYPVGWELGAGEGRDSFHFVGGEYKLRHREAWAGVNYAFSDGHWRPYVGGGLQFSQQQMDLTLSGSTLQQNLQDFGPYLEAGMRTHFTRSTHFVVGFRRTFGLEGSVGVSDVDLDYTKAFVGFGYSF